jgi:hypothetical protein
MFYIVIFHHLHDLCSILDDPKQAENDSELTLSIVAFLCWIALGITQLHMKPMQLKISAREKGQLLWANPNLASWACSCEGHT